MGDDWKLSIRDSSGKTYPISFELLETLKDPSIPVEEYVPRKQAEAVYLSRLLEYFQIPSPSTQVVIQAVDGFVQQIEKEDCEQAFLVFKHKGEPLSKGFPARLYVPGRDSDCLNVKSVVEIKLLKD